MNIITIVILFILIYGAYRLLIKLVSPIDNNFGYKYSEYKKNNNDFLNIILTASASLLIGLLIWAFVMELIIIFVKK